MASRLKKSSARYTGMPLLKGNRFPSGESPEPEAMFLTFCQRLYWCGAAMSTSRATGSGCIMNMIRGERSSWTPMSLPQRALAWLERMLRCFTH